MHAVNDYSFRLIALGSPHLEIHEAGSDVVRTIGPGKNLAILAYLALSPGRSTTRDRLCDLLWGDRDLARSRPQLRQTLWLIRTQIGAEIVNTSKDKVLQTKKLERPLALVTVGAPSPKVKAVVEALRAEASRAAK